MFVSVVEITQKQEPVTFFRLENQGMCVALDLVNKHQKCWNDLENTAANEKTLLLAIYNKYVT